MFGLSHWLGRSGSAGGRPAPQPVHLHARPNLEELERRDVPAPVVIGPTALPGTLAARDPFGTGTQGQLLDAQPGQNTSPTATTALGVAVFQAPGTAGLTGTNTFGLPAGAGTAFGPAISLAAGASPTAPFATGQLLPAPTFGSISAGVLISPGQSFTVGPNFNNGITGPLPGGAPNPVRTGPVTPLTLGPFASLPGTSPYTEQDIRLTGGGGGPTVILNRPPDGWNPNDPQTRVLIVDSTSNGDDAAPDWSVLEEAVFQLTAPGSASAGPAPAATPAVDGP